MDDDGESVKLGFANLPTGVSAGATDETIVSITDDDVPAVTVSVEQAAYAVAEGDSVTVKVVLSAAPERTVTVQLTKSNQGGASNADYSVPASVVFNSGDTEKTLSFAAADDTSDDDGESVKLGFGSLPTRVSAGATNEATVSITDTDVPVVSVSFGSATYSVDEGDGVTPAPEIEVADAKVGARGDVERLAQRGQQPRPRREVVEDARHLCVWVPPQRIARAASR